MTFLLNAQLGGGYAGAFRNAQAALTQYRKEYAQVSSAIGDVGGFQKQQQAVENTRGRLALLQQQYDNIQNEIDETGNHSSDLANKLLDKQAQIEKFSQALQAQIEKLEAYRQKLDDAGVNTDDLKKETERLKKELEGVKAKFKDAGDGAESFGQGISTLDNAIAALGLTKLLQSAYRDFMDCVSASTEFEYSMAGVRRTVGGTDEYLADLGQAFKDMSTEIPITTTELGTIAETAGQLGIAQELVEEFTLVMAELGTTTDLTADSAATMLAQFANITGITDYERLGSVVASLGDATATTASKVVEMSLGMAASASIAGFSERDILAVSAAVGSLGIESAAGSTAMSQLISTLYKATETGEKLEEIASIAGMSAEEFRVAWGQDAVGAMNEFVQGLTDVERNGRSAIVLLDELGINNVRQVKAILSLAQAGDLLSGTIAQANAAWEENTALGEKANVMYSTTQARLTMMQNEGNNLKVAIGDVFLPMMNKLYQALGNLFGSLASFVQAHPQIVKAITAMLTAVAAFVAIVVAAKVAVMALNAVIATNPYLLLGAAVLSLCTGLIALVASLDDTKEKQEKLTAASLEQKRALEELRNEYDEVCEAEGETSASAVILKERIDEANQAFEDSKQTQEEYLKAHDELMESLRSQASARADASEALDTEYQETARLIERLNELTKAEHQSYEAKEEILMLIDLINDRMPQLGLTYDRLTGIMNISPENIAASAKADYEKEKLEADYKNLGKITYEDIPKAQSDLETATKEAEAAKAAVDALDQQWYKLISGGGRKTKVHYQNAFTGETLTSGAYGRRVRAAESEYEKLEGKRVEAEEALSALESEADVLSKAVGDYFKESAAVASGEVEGVLDLYSDKISELNELYTASYEAAYESINGQYQLWDEVAEVSATSVDKVIENLEKQKQYWENYNSNIQLILRYAGQIEGLSEMVASFGDGSADSVNMIAGMAEAAQSGDPSKLQALVTAWQSNQKAIRTTSESLGDLKTGYSAAMKEAEDEIAAAIATMDKTDEAVTAGKDTIQGFIDGANDMLPLVQRAYARIGEAAANALGLPTSAIHAYRSPTESGFSVGTRSAAPGYHLVGEYGPELRYFYGGERVYTAAETRSMMRDYQAMEGAAYLSAPEGAAPARASGGTTLNFSPVYQISAAADPTQLQEVLTAHDETLKEQLRELLEEEREDARRGAYV